MRELARQHAPAVITELARLALKAKNEHVRVAAGKELLDRGYGKAGPLVLGYDDVLDDRYPDHGGRITIEFVSPPDRPEPIVGEPRTINGSGHSKTSERSEH